MSSFERVITDQRPLLSLYPLAMPRASGPHAASAEDQDVTPRLAQPRESPMVTFDRGFKGSTGKLELPLLLRDDETHLSFLDLNQSQ